MRFYFKSFLALLSITGVLLTLYTVYKLQYSHEKPAWLLSYKSKIMAEVEKRQLEKKSFVEKVQACMDSAKVCEETVDIMDGSSPFECDKGRFTLFFRCVGLKKDTRSVVPVNSDYH